MSASDGPNHGMNEWRAFPLTENRTGFHGDKMRLLRDVSSVNNGYLEKDTGSRFLVISNAIPGDRKESWTEAWSGDLPCRFRIFPDIG